MGFRFVEHVPDFFGEGGADAFDGLSTCCSRGLQSAQDLSNLGRIVFGQLPFHNFEDGGFQPRIRFFVHMHLAFEDWEACRRGRRPGGWDGEGFGNFCGRPEARGGEQENVVEDGRPNPRARGGWIRGLVGPFGSRRSAKGEPAVPPTRPAPRVGPGSPRDRSRCSTCSSKGRRPAGRRAGGPWRPKAPRPTSRGRDRS